MAQLASAGWLRDNAVQSPPQVRPWPTNSRPRPRPTRRTRAEPEPAGSGVLRLRQRIPELTNKQSQQQDVRRISMASLYAAARFNAHVYLVSVKPIHAAGERKDFLDYMTTMYRRMLNEHLDGMGQSAASTSANPAGGRIRRGGRPGRRMGPTPAGDYVAAGAVPPAASNE